MRRSMLTATEPTRMFRFGRAAMEAGTVDWVADDIWVVLCQVGTYVPDFRNDQWLSDVPGQVAAAALTGRVVMPGGGRVDAADTNVLTVPGPAPVFPVIYKNTGSPASSPLLGFVLDGSVGLPVTPNGGTVRVQWDSNGILPNY